ncbi:MAG: gliding motility-associated C-terminal domain-containing protein [Bacteroidetes bacterium]|nr:MAG: gliding motility-associated C-terminal domain-containing protein [Bacteroidota bacterium]
MKVFYTACFTFLITTLFAQSASGPDYLLSCAINLGPDVTVCNNAVFSLNPHPNPDGNYSWTGSPGLSCYDCPTPSFSGLPTGTYTYIATITTPDCSASDTIKIMVINGTSPMYAIAPDQDICAGDTVNLGGPAQPGTFYNWYSNPPGFSSNLSNPKDKPTGPVTYYLSASNNSCPLIVLDSVKIIPISLMLNLNPADSFRLCQGRSRTIQALISPAGQPVVWSPLTGLQVGSNGTTVIAAPQQSTLYTATASMGGCVRKRQLFIAVDSLPVDLDLQPADTTICAGSAVTLTSGDGMLDSTAFPKITFKWSPLSGAISADSMLSLTVQPTQSTVYRRITRNGVCADTALSTVKVIPQAQISVTPPSASICPGDTVHLNVSFTSGVSGINWSPASGLSCTNCTDPVAQPDSTTVYTVSGAYQGCPVSASTVISLKPQAPLQLPDDLQLCKGDTLRLNTIFDPLASYRWASTHPGFDTTYQPTPVFVPTQTAWYFIRTDNGCIRNDSFQVTVLSATLSVVGDTTICKNFSIPLLAMASLPGSFIWQNTQNGQTVGNSAAATVKPTETTTYVVTYTYGDGCTLSGQVFVVVDGEAPDIVFPQDNVICAGESLLLNSSIALPGAVYQWAATPPDPTLDPAAPNPVVMPAQQTNYSVTASLDNCTVSKQITVVTSNATLTVTADTTLCAGSMLTLTASGTDPMGTYSWSTGASNPQINVTPAAPVTYTVTYFFGDGCQIQDSVQVNTVPGFDLDIHCVPDTNQIDIGTDLTLTAVVTPPQNLDNFQFVWQETTVDTQVLPFDTESIDVTPSSNDTAAAIVRYTLTATAPNGCSRVMEKTIRLVFPIVRFPNAFTPDGDGINDRFELILATGLAYIDRMEIYNRWGQKVFESTEPNAGWDGMVDGEQAASDVYIFRVWWRRGDGALQMQSKGNVILLR